jgi:N,N'-diacetyllegionaminate synthase
MEPISRNRDGRPLTQRVVIIAEAGVNHNGDMATAKKLIDVAAAAGAAFVKFQTFKAETLATTDAPKADYQKQAKGAADQTQLEMLRSLELSKEQHVELMNHCEANKISFLSTGFDTASLDLLFELGVRLFKVPSGELTNLPYLEHMAGFQCPVYLSTGMATLEEIKWAVDILVSAGLARGKISVLHCTTAYPTPITQANLSAITTLQNELQLPIGYSDHTTGITASIAAVALGATVIEKHFTLSRDQEGPDHNASLEPDELISLVNGIREVSSALGTGEKIPQDCELENIPVARKSIVARKHIGAGEEFTVENLTTKRPGTGISPIHWHEVLGTKANRSYSLDEMISFE